MRDFLKLLPLTVIYPAILSAMSTVTSVGPDDAVSNISKWATRLGWNSPSSWLSHKLPYNEATTVALAFSAAYILVFIVIPRIRKQRLPGLIVQKVVTVVLLQFGMIVSATACIGFAVALLWPLKMPGQASINTPLNSTPQREVSESNAEALPPRVPSSGSGPALDIQAPFVNNVMRLRSTGVQQAMRNTAEVKDNSFDIETRSDNGSFEPTHPEPVPAGKPMAFQTSAELRAHVDQFCATLLQMRDDIYSKRPDMHAVIEVFNRKNDEYRARYAGTGDDLELSLVRKLGWQNYTSDRPTLLSAHIAAGLDPFAEAANYLQHLMSDVEAAEARKGNP